MASALFILLVIVFLIYLFIKWLNKDTSTYENSAATNKQTATQTTMIDSKEKIVEPEFEYFIDADGRKFRLENRTREIPRRTYIHGNLLAKYRGEIDKTKEKEYHIQKFFPFEIYEAIIEVKPISEYDCSCVNATKIKCEGYHKGFEGAFNFIADANFSSVEFPNEVVCISFVNGEKVEFKVNLKEHQINNIRVDRKLHQHDGEEVFGTFEANITGYILDYLYEDYQEPIYLDEPAEDFPEPIIALTKTNVVTGNIENKNGYKRTEYYYSDYKSTYWGDWNYTKSAEPPFQEGCSTTVLRILGLIIGLFFLLALLPSLGYLLPFILIPLFLRLFSSNILSWIFRIIGILLLLGFALSLFSLFLNKSSFHPKPKITIPQDVSIKDSLIKHIISWNDYDNAKYEGTYWIRSTDYYNAKNFKSTLQLSIGNRDGYSRMVYELKENDKNNLSGLYQLYDSLKNTNKLDEKRFAEMVVSMTQEIPYTIVLPNACDGSLYNDKFTQQYLASSDAHCDGFERFGINSPVEFMTTLKGDCDTRTLLLYTILSHYNYDVAMLSSEFYGHSLLGINLPYDGTIYNYNNQHYVLWETTAPNIKPGIISNQVANLNYWKITLKSK